MLTTAVTDELIAPIDQNVYTISHLHGVMVDSGENKHYGFYIGTGPTSRHFQARIIIIDGDLELSSPIDIKSPFLSFSSDPDEKTNEHKTVIPLADPTSIEKAIQWLRDHGYAKKPEEVNCP
jgi:hypothetical protein